MKAEDYYLAKSAETSVSARVGWSSPAVQEAGFRAVSQLFAKDMTRPTVLDVGAGLGELQEWLNYHDIVVKYMGVEPLEPFVKSAEILGRAVVLGRGEEVSTKKCDYAVAHGTFNMGTDVEAGTIIKSMWEAASKGIAFTMLETSPGAGFNAYDPHKVEEFCKAMSPAPRSVEVKAFWPGQFVVRVTK